MANGNALSRWSAQITDKLSEQVWVQQLRAKWDELDPQSRTYLKLASAVGCGLLATILTISSIWKVHSLKVELREKTALNEMIQTANEEIRKLRDSAPPAADTGGRDATPWNTHFESTAGTAGIGKENIEISSEKPGTGGEIAKEALYELTLKKVNIKQAVKYAFYLESGSRPVKLRNLTLAPQDDGSGYLNVTLSVSAFTLK